MNNTLVNNKVVNTNFADYCLKENGIMQVDFNIKFDDKIKLMDAQLYVSIVVQLCSETPRPFLINCLHFNNLPSFKILKFFAQNKDIQGLPIAKAVVLNSSVVRMIVMQYFKISDNDYPFKIFKSQTEAEDWLKSFL